MKITVYAANGGGPIERKPFDLIESHTCRECWIRYRGGRLFVRSMFGGPWRPFRFEPKRGNAYEVSVS